MPSPNVVLMYDPDGNSEILKALCSLKRIHIHQGILRRNKTTITGGSEIMVNDENP
jgi:hypothetical protein